MSRAGLSKHQCKARHGIPKPYSLIKIFVCKMSSKKKEQNAVTMTKSHAEKRNYTGKQIHTLLLSFELIKKVIEKKKHLFTLVMSFENL